MHGARVRRRYHLLGVALSVLTASVATVSATSTSAHAGPIGTALGCTRNGYQATQAAMRAVYNAINTLPSYTGTALLNSCGPIDVYVTANGAAAAEAAAAAASPRTFLRFHFVRNSFQTLLRVQQQITTDYRSLVESGISIHQYWPDMTTGLERIEVVNATPSQVASLTRRYGSTNVSVTTIDNPSPIVVTDNATGQNAIVDAPPWSGGDALYWTDGNWNYGCTAGPPVHTFTSSVIGLPPTENYFLITAGHCELGINGTYEGNHLVLNGLTDAAYGSNITVGDFGASGLGNSIDAMLIPTQGRSTHLDWLGWYQGGSQYPQLGPQTALVGDQVCAAGAYDGTNCWATVQQGGYRGCITVSDAATNLNFCNEINATNSFPGVGQGDSGATVYLNEAGPGITPTGVQSAGTTPFVACPHFQYRGNVCTTSFWFTDLPTILQTLGVALNTATAP